VVLGKTIVPGLHHPFLFIKVLAFQEQGTCHSQSTMHSAQVAGVMPNHKKASPLCWGREGYSFLRSKKAVKHQDTKQLIHCFVPTQGLKFFASRGE